MSKITFKVELQRVLEVLSKEIYDSPYALLRENVQNAYDAILMRAGLSEGKWSAQNDGLIRVTIDSQKIIVSDNGIGMSEQTITNNYWQAGSSGKNTELAAKSGVVGRFGIGGMANFGVSTKLTVESESIENKKRIKSEVERDKLSLNEPCITIQEVVPTGEYGTTVTAMLDPDSGLILDKAESYLVLYVQYLPTRVELNGKVISEKSASDMYRDETAKIQSPFKGFEFGGVKADIIVQINDTGRVSCTLSNISISGQSIEGAAYLRQDVGHLWGQRSYFGLSPIPASSVYSFGGIVNLSILSPTAGREALTRESIEVVSKIIRLADERSTQVIASFDIGNKSTPFMSHLISTNRINLADKLVIKVEPEGEITLGELREQSQKRKIQYYDGNDSAIISAHATPETPLVVLSRSNPRRQIESLFIKRYCKMDAVDNLPKVLKMYDEKYYTISEMSFVIKVKHILEDDYAIANVNLKFADLSHNLPYIVKAPSQGPIEIFIQRNHFSITPVLKCYEDAYDVFQGFIKDYIRVHIYPQIRNRVPSSTKEGAEALQKILRQKKELVELSSEDVGVTSLITEFLSGKIEFKEVVQTARTFQRSQSQEIKAANVGNFESEIPDLGDSPIRPPKDSGKVVLVPLPPILRMDIITEKKLLLTEKKNPSLNDFQAFLAISDRAFNEEYDFFLNPHTTRIIWGGRRIIFIFTHASERFSLYYDVEIFEDTGKIAGGSVFPTTTIVTNKRIFIPIPDNLRQFFELVDGKRKFYVRFDTIASS